jgi:hypothetical protein
MNLFVRLPWGVEIHVGNAIYVDNVPFTESYDVSYGGWYGRVIRVGGTELTWSRRKPGHVT